MFFKKAEPPTRPKPPEPLDDEARDRKVLADAEMRLAQGRLGARCLLPDGQEFACIARHITMSQAEIHVSRTLPLNTIIVLYLDVLGLVQARVRSTVPGGYVVTLNVARERRPEFASRLEQAELATEAPEERVAPRITPNERKTFVELPSGHRIDGEIIDLSTSGIAIRMSPKPGIGVTITIGQRGRIGTVVRHTPDGMAAQFNAPLRAEEFGADIKL